jgi:hypothetical protein
VLHTVHAEAANIKASYVSINCRMMGCRESNWMTETEQQMEKLHLETFGYKYNALNTFQDLKKEIPCVVTLEFRASTGYTFGSNFITHTKDNSLLMMS